MLLSFATACVLAGTPSLHSVSSTKDRCALLSRQAPDWKPVTLAEWPQSCPGASVRWSSDGLRALVDGKPSLLLDAATKQRTALPPTPKGGRPQLRFGTDGRVFALADDDAMMDAVAWAWALEDGKWKLVETAKIAVPGLVGGAAQLKTAAKLVQFVNELKGTHQAKDVELKRLKVPMGPDMTSWQVATAGSSLVAWQMMGTDSCSAFAPIVVLPKGKAITLPFPKWPADPCRGLFVLEELLLVDSSTLGPNYRAELVDLTTGAVLVSLPGDERDAVLLQFSAPAP